MVTLNGIGAISTIAISIACDTHSREIILEAPAEVRHISETLAVETAAQVENINHHWRMVPYTMHVLGEDESTANQQKGRCGCQYTINLLLESVYSYDSLTFHLSQ